MCGYAEQVCGAQSRDEGSVSVKSLLVRYCPTEISFLLLPKDSENLSCTCPLAGNHTAQVEHL